MCKSKKNIFNKNQGFFSKITNSVYLNLLYNMTLPNEFFTIQSFSTLTGATGITVVVTNGLKNAFKINPAWLGLIVALLISLAGVCLTGETKASDYLIGLLNGFLIFATAAGANEAGSRKQVHQPMAPAAAASDDVYGTPEDTYEQDSVHEEIRPRRPFFTSWF